MSNKGHKKQFCKYGHDTFEYGRTKHGYCRQCSRERAKKYRKTHKRKYRLALKKWRSKHKKEIQVYNKKFKRKYRKRLLEYSRKRYIPHPRIYIKKRFCLRGHDKDVVGRVANGSCLKCALIRAKRYYKLHKKLMQKRGRKNYHKHRIKYIKIARAYQAKHKKEIREKQRKWRNKNRIKIRKIKKRWNYKNRKKIRRQARERSAFRRKTDLQYKMRVYLRARLSLAIKNKQKKGSAVRDLGCTIEFFLIYIKKKFKKGMIWNNWGKVWDLDHKKALSKFDLTDRKQFKQAVHYTNLQPLTIPDHVKKTNKEIKAFWRRR